MTAARSRRLHAERAVGVLVSLAALAGCVWWALRQEAPRFPSGVGGWALAATALGLYAVETVVRGWRWHSILNFAGIRQRFRDAVEITTIGYMGNNVLPARGGEVLRILLMGRRSSGRRREVLGTIVPERILDAAALCLLFGSVTALGAGVGESSGWLTAGGLAATFGGALALYAYHRLRGMGYFEAFAARVRPVAAASRLLITPRGGALLAVTALLWLAEGLTFVLCAHALDVPIGYFEAFATIVLASFVALVPSAPGYVGTFDAAIIVGVGAAGVGEPDALSLLLLYRFVVFVPITLAGFALLATRHGGLRTLRSPAREPVAS